MDADYERMFKLIYPDDCKRDIDLINTEKIADHITISTDDLRKLWRLFHLTFEKDGYIYLPADIVFQKTVPIPNMRITISDFFEANGYETEEKSLTAEICLFAYQELGKITEEEWSKHIIGVGVISYPGMFQHIGLDHDEMMFDLGDVGIDTRLDKEEIDKCVDFYLKDGRSFERTMIQRASEFISAWYTIQIALLNPLTREIFSAPRITAERIDKPSKKAKQKVRYVRNHYLTADKLERVLNEHQGVRKYTCLAWYVCGHWRTYKDGKKIFIQPYWKGEMREARAKLDDLCREREIAQISKEVCA